MKNPNSARSLEPGGILFISVARNIMRIRMTFRRLHMRLNLLEIVLMMLIESFYVPCGNGTSFGSSTLVPSPPP